MGKASLPKTGINDTLDANRERKKQFGRERAAATGIIGTSLGTGGGGFNATGNNTIQAPTLPTAGGTMIGPIAFYLKSATVADGVINVSKDNAYSSRVIVVGQGAAADDLEVILGASHAGQILFFQPIQAITLQSYLKTATAWANGTSYSVGDVILSASQRYTCHTAHTAATATNKPGTGSAWNDFWYRNNIRITGADERVVAIDEIIMLQYDSTDGVWTVISGGGTSGSGGAGLGDANVWTNVNTFQSTVSMTGPTVNLGDASTDRVNFISQAGTDLNMGTYDVVNVDRFKFATAAGAGSALGTSDTGIEAQFSGGSSAGVKFQVPTNNIYQFFSGSTERVNIGSSLILLNHNVTITDDLTIQDNLQVYDDCTLGSSITDDIDINGRVEIGNSYTASVASYPSLALGYITVKVGGSYRNIWVS